MGKQDSFQRSTLVVVLLLVAAITFTGCAGGGLPGMSTPGGANPQQQMNNSQFFVSTLWFFVLGMIGYFFLVTRPAIQKEESQKKFVSELKKGEEVLTSGGIAGRVHAVATDFITVEIAQNVRIRVKPDHLSALDKSQSGSSVTAEEKR